MKNKKETIIVEAKKLFGQYGYLGFTLKQLAEACQMTSPALYYFYPSKADLFKDCLLSEMEARQAAVRQSAEHASNLREFGREFANKAIEVCKASEFRVGRAMEEVVHLPADMQKELWTAWDTLVINPVVDMLDRMLPAKPSEQPSRRLIATFIINTATFSAGHDQDFDREELAALFTAIMGGIESALSTPCSA